MPICGRSTFVLLPPLLPLEYLVTAPGVDGQEPTEKSLEKRTSFADNLKAKMLSHQVQYYLNYGRGGGGVTVSIRRVF